MDNLSRIAQGIFLGNGEVWNFLDYAVNRNCGGLLYKTQQLDLLDSNFTNNFNGGHKRKYNYEGEDTDNIPTFNAYSINPLTGKIFSTDLVRNTVNSSYPIHGGGGNLGDLYTVPEFSSNSALKFITKESFTALGKQIRDDQTSSNGLAHYKNSDGENEYYERFSPESYATEVSNAYSATSVSSKGLGDDVDIQYIENSDLSKKYTLLDFGEKAKDVSDGYQKVIKDKIRDKNLFPGIYHDYSTDTVESYNGIEAVSLSQPRYKVRKVKEGGRIYKALKPLLSVASEKRKVWESKERKLLTNNFEGSLNPDGNKVTVNTEGYGDVLIDTTKYNLSEYINENNGLYDYYGAIRITYISPLFKKNSLWNRYNSYGVEFNERGQEYYSINEENKYEGDVQISVLQNGGEQSQFGPESNARTYYYYEEKEKEEVPIDVKTSTIDGSVVSLSDYNSSSRLLQKTNELFRQGKINSLVNRFHTDTKGAYNELTTAYDDKFGISRGRNLIRKEYEGKDSGDKSTGYDNPYCRTWTAHHQYSKLKDRIRPFVDESGEPITVEDTQSNYGFLRTPEGAYNLTEYSVLRSDGFVRITPTHIDGKIFNEPVKNYMFSIENLAWRDVTSDINNKSLSPEQRGPNGGRIMWFPPYNLRFSENVNVNWNANTFIGRGEEIYTYTNTVRTGTLDFTLLIDHPSILNKWRGTSSEIDKKEEKERDLLRFFAGCGNINDAVEPTKPIKEEEEAKTEELPKVDPKPTYHTKKIAYVVFFPNNFSGYDYLKKGQNFDDAIVELRNYNSNASSEKQDKDFASRLVKDYNKVSEGLTPKTFDIEIKQTLFAGADDIDEIHYFDDLENIGTQITGDKIFGYSSQNCKVLNIEVKGFASSHGNEKLNKNLCDRRRTLVEELIKEKAPYLEVEWSKKEGTIINVPDIGNMQYVNAKEAKLARAAYAIVNIQWKEDNKTGDDSLSDDVTKTLNGASFSGYSNRESSGSTKAANIHISKEVLDEEYTYDNEYLYFSEIMGDELVHKHIVDKVRFFDPAFHSITPEGFNARLTFLHQCTRQGPTNAVSSGRVKVDDGDNYLTFAGNLAFGRAPYCILRIGDFFNTKICIDSMSITYDNNGVQWDLNPEGVGVQPMYANVSLSFKFLGGQDLVKPIERLQNAVTANYYANASVYSRQADTNKYYYDAFEGEPKIKTNK